MHTFHRGSRLLAAECVRLTFHNVVRGAGLEWMGWRAWPHEGQSAEMRRFVEQATVIGFPEPGHPDWTPRTLEGVQLRYPNLDMSMDCAALGSRGGGVV